VYVGRLSCKTYNWISFYKRIHKVIAIKADESLSKITSQIEEKSNHFYVNNRPPLDKIDNVSVNVIEAKGFAFI
jgi:hypothetical protein